MVKIQDGRRLRFMLRGHVDQRWLHHVQWRHWRTVLSPIHAIIPPRACFISGC